MLDNLRVVLFRTKFSENVGATARACANMGCRDIVLVAPRRWDIEKARPMATSKGGDLLDEIRIVSELPEAIADCAHVYGTTARIGGWRKGLLSPSRAAEQITQYRAGNAQVAVVFGPEDRGLTNEQTEVCSQLVTIPTDGDASSLNLAQAVLVILYECLTKQLDSVSEPAKAPQASNLATHEEQELLFANLQETLLSIDFIEPGNPDYWMLPVRRFLLRSPFRRAEFNMLMGLCRQIKWVAAKAKTANK